MSELERCRPWIEAALVFGGGTHAFEDVAASLGRGHMQLWPAPRGCIVTEILSFPRKRVLNVFLAGGELEQIKDMDHDAVAWAKAQGCTEASCLGRPGWERALAGLGWTRLHVVLRKEL